MPIQTLSELFLEVLRHDKPVCLLHKPNPQAGFQPISTRELADGVARVAAALKELGVERGDRVALMAENSPHWATIDFATLCVGAVLVPVYPTLLPEGAAYVIADSGAKVVFVEGAERLEGLLGQREAMPAVERVIAIHAEVGAGTDAVRYEDLLARSTPLDRETLEREARAATPDDLATFIYTSGTTGNPKGVMLTHGNITSNVVDASTRIDLEADYTALSFLPLSHSFERTVDYIYFYKGVTIAYAESVQVVAQNMAEVKPHVFVSVPRVYEKVQGRILENVAKSSGLKQKLFHWAIAVGRESLEYRLKGTKPTGLLGLEFAIADKLVFSKIRERLGGRFEFAISGGAPLSKDLAEFFWGAGIRIFEGYGLTETSPVLTVNTPEKVKLGTVGTAIPKIELRIADDGEILARGPNIMRGYYNNPESTAETIDDEGWFHTGDIGNLDEEGFLAITDRKKEIIVNAYGKNIAPAPIENALKASRFIGQAVIIGDRRKFLAALLVPDLENLRAWAQGEGIRAENDEELVENGRVQALYGQEIEALNEKLARYEQIHAWRLLPNEFTLETGELTPTQKVKRRVIHEKYGSQIESMYAAAAGD